MHSELTSYLRAERRLPFASREVVRAAQLVRDDVQISAFMVDGAIALAGHVMEATLELDAHRRLLARDDISLNAQLGEIQQIALFQVKKLQAALYSDWGL